jgi:hypothetical protein
MTIYSGVNLQEAAEYEKEEELVNKVDIIEQPRPEDRRNAVVIAKSTVKEPDHLWGGKNSFEAKGAFSEEKRLLL